MLFCPRRRAFSIVELVIAVAVLVFGVYAVYNQFLQTRIPSQQRLLTAQARMLAHQRLEELRACPFEALEAWKAPAGYTRLESAPRFHARSAVASRADGALEMTVAVGWDAVDAAGQVFPEGKEVVLKGLRAS